MAVFADRAVTAQKIIARAMRLIGVYGVGDTMGAEEGIDGLASLNAMIDEWANEKLMISAASLDVIALQPNVASYTIGPTGGTVSNYPIEIDPASYIQYNSLSYPLEVLTLAEYNALTLKSLSTLIPESLWYNTTFPNGTVTLYPIPSAVMTLNLWSWKQIASFPALTSLIALAPGYENAIVYNLCEALAPEYGVAVPPLVQKLASTSKKKVKRANFVMPMLSAGVGVSSGGRFNILGGRNL